MTVQFLLVAVASLGSDPSTSDTIDLRNREPLHTFGRTWGVEGDDPLAFGSVADVAVDVEGRIYVLDRVGHRAVRLNADGSLDRTFGRRGSGPGELETPSFMHLTTDSLVLLDQRQQRLVVFSTVDGGQRTESLHERGPRWFRYFPVTDDLQIGLTLPLISGEASSLPVLMAVVMIDGRRGVTDTIVRFPLGMFMGRQAEGRIMPTNHSVGPHGALALSGDSLIAIGEGRTGVIHVFRPVDARLESVVVLSIPQRASPVTDRQRDSIRVTWQEGVRDRLGNRIRLDRNVDIVGPDHWSLIADVFWGQDGSLWAVSRGAGGDGWWCFPTLDDPPIRVIFPEGFYPSDVFAGKLYGLHENELGAPLVRVYEL